MEGKEGRKGKYTQDIRESKQSPLACREVAVVLDARL